MPPDPSPPDGADVPVSIIIPNHNRRDLVGEAIESALEQGPEFEVIVVDDGSSDDSWPIIQSFGARLRAFRQENAGAGAARNAALRIARGRYVRFLDSDDRMPPHSLRAQLGSAERLPPLQVAVGDAASIDAQGKLFESGIGYGYAASAPPGPIPRATVLRNVMSVCLPLFPAEALRALGGFDPSVAISEDHELAIRLLRAGYRFVRLPIVVCEVREHGGERLSRNLGAEGFRRLESTYSRLWGALEADGAQDLTTEERGALGQLVWTLARDAVRSGFPEEARRLFGLAGRIGGRRARTGRLPARLAYRLLPPVSAEHLLNGVKKLAGRRA